MNIRLGYTGNSRILKNCSTNKTVSVSVLNKELDVNKKLNKLKKVAKDNILNTLRILESNKALGIDVYGISPKLFPLANYPELEYFRYIDTLKPELLELGNYIKENNIRVNIHLDNTIIINSMSEKVLQDAIKDIKYQNVLLNSMGLDAQSKIIINVGGAYINKNDAIERFHTTLSNLDESLKRRLVLKNEDSSIPVSTMAKICNEFSIPFFLNIDDKNINDDDINKSIKSWENEELPALLGLKANSGLAKLSGVSGIDVILGNVEKELNITLKVWRQRGPQEKGAFETYQLEGISTESSFLEMLDVLNEKLVKERKEPVVFDHDCREGICGMCSLYINGHPHGNDQDVTT